MRIVGLVLGVLLLLSGAGLLAASFVVGQGQQAVNTQVQQAGLTGPVDGTVVKVNSGSVTVRYKDARGHSHTAQGELAISRQPKVGDVVPVYYQPDEPSAVLVSDLPANGLGQLGDGLRLVGFITLGVGAVLVVASTLGLVVARHRRTLPARARPAALAGPNPGSAPVPRAQAGYPADASPTVPPGPLQPYPPVPVAATNQWGTDPAQPYSPTPAGTWSGTSPIQPFAPPPVAAGTWTGAGPVGPYPPTPVAAGTWSGTVPVEPYPSTPLAGTEAGPVQPHVPTAGIDTAGPASVPHPANAFSPQPPVAYPAAPPTSPNPGPPLPISNEPPTVSWG